MRKIRVTNFSSGRLHSETFRNDRISDSNFSYLTVLKINCNLQSVYLAPFVAQGASLNEAWVLAVLFLPPVDTPTDKLSVRRELFDTTRRAFSNLVSFAPRASGEPFSREWWPPVSTDQLIAWHGPCCPCSCPLTCKLQLHRRAVSPPCSRLVEIYPVLHHLKNYFKFLIIIKNEKTYQ